MRILYGVCGEGNGHATRSKVVIDYLRQKHDVLICAGGAAYTYLKKQHDVDQIPHFSTAYSNNKVQNLTTGLRILFKLPYYFAKLYEMCKKIKELCPDIIITDLEPIVLYAGIIKGKKIISIDNPCMLLHTQIEYPKKTSFIKMHPVMKLLSPKAHHYFITSFFSAPKKRPNITIIPPIIRKEILQQKTSTEDFYLVYQTSTSNKKLLEILRQMPQKFIIYGFDIEKKEENLEFKKNSENDFIDKLASCKGVITNGGFTLMTEALYLRKPILSLPIKGQFEQEVNAHYLKKLELGMTSFETDREPIEEFIEYAEKFKPNKSIITAGEMFFEMLENKLKELRQK